MGNETPELANSIGSVETAQRIGRYFTEIQVVYLSPKHSSRFQGRQKDAVLPAFKQSSSQIQCLPLGAAFVEAVYELENAQSITNPVGPLMFFVDILAMPKLQHQQRPQTHRVIATAALMLVEQ